MVKRLFGGVVIANNGFDKERANEALAEGRADLIAFGKPFIANPDLVIRLFLDAPLLQPNRETLYGGGEQGYTDYPILRASRPTPVIATTPNALGDDDVTLDRLRAAVCPRVKPIARHRFAG